METIISTQVLQNMLQEEGIVVALLSDLGCNVCLAIYPELEDMAKRYPAVRFVSADVEKMKTLVGAYRVFLYPTVIVFVNGKESLRFERVFSIDSIEATIERYLEILYAD